MDIRATAAMLAGCLAFLLCQCTTVKHPVQIKDKEWSTADGKTLPYQKWPKPEEQLQKTTEAAKPAPKAVLICVHGLSGASSDFWPAGEALPAKGYLVYGVELRGMGNDPDKATRGDIRSRRIWQEDLLTFTREIKKRHPGLPIYWFGESLGALIVIHSLAQLPDQSALVAGVILTSPVINFRMELPWWKYYPLRLLIALIPWKRLALEDLGDSEVKVTNTSTHKGQMQHTPHYVEFFTLRLFGQIEKMVRQSDEAARKFQVPTFVFYTPNDVFSSKEQVEAFYDQIASQDKGKHFFPNSYHLLLHDVDRDPAVKILTNWLEQQTSRNR